jgi:ribosomal protein L32
MAATMKHRRSASKRNSTRGADRYDKALTKAKKIAKKGGSFLVKVKTSKSFVPSHTVCEDNPTYKGVKVLNPKTKK